LHRAVAPAGGGGSAWGGAFNLAARCVAAGGGTRFRDVGDVSEATGAAVATGRTESTGCPTRMIGATGAESARVGRAAGRRRGATVDGGALTVCGARNAGWVSRGARVAGADCA